MIDNLSCLLQSKRLLVLYSDVSDVDIIGRTGRPNASFDDYITSLPIERQKRINDRAAKLIAKIK